MIRHEVHTVHDLRTPFSFRALYLKPSPTNVNYLGNWHEDLELLAIKKGTATIYIGDKIITATAGDIVVLNSNLIHSMYPCDSTVYYDCLIINPTFCSDNYIDIFSLHFRSLIQDPKLFALIDELREEFPHPHTSATVFAMEENQKMKYFLSQRAIVLRILSHMYRSHLVAENVTPSKRDTNEKIKRALEFVHANIHRDLSLDEVAEVVGLNSSYFSREFRRITQINFVAYVNQVRCECAKHYLKKKNLSIAEISEQCGFRNQGYFSRIFLQVEGVTPSEYQKITRNEK